MFKGRGDEKGLGGRSRNGWHDDKEQLNSLVIFSCTKKQLKVKMIKIYVGA